MTTGAAPPLSIGLPVYNGEPFLAETLDSLLGQTYGDFELIVSDNGSIDATEEICRAYARTDARVSYDRNTKNRGAAWNFNRVLARSRGTYFKWAAHDDVYEPRYLERSVEALDASPPSVVLAFPWSRVIDQRGATVWKHRDGLDTRGLSPHERLRRLVWNPPTVGTAVFGVTRTDALQHTRGCGAFPSSDYVVLAELALLGEFVEIPEYLFLRRFHPGMSREANRTDAEVAEWFLPGSGRAVLPEYWTLLFQHLVSIERTPMAATEKLRCYAVFVPGWLRVWDRCLAGELRELAARLFRHGRRGRR